MRLFEGTEFDIPPRCERCNELEADCQCEPIPEPKLPPHEQTAKVKTEKRKRGKLVTIISGLARHECDLDDLLTTLKNYCGAGGTIKEDSLEIQGDQLTRVREKLKELGFNVR